MQHEYRTQPSAQANNMKILMFFGGNKNLSYPTFGWLVTKDILADDIFWSCPGRVETQIQGLPDHLSNLVTADYQIQRGRERHHPEINI